MLRNEYSKRQIKEHNKEYNQINYCKLQDYFKQYFKDNKIKTKEKKKYYETHKILKKNQTE